MAKRVAVSDIPGGQFSSWEWNREEDRLNFRIYYCCLVAKSCPTPYNPVDCSLQGSSVPWISKARILDWLAISSSRGSS